VFLFKKLTYPFFLLVSLLVPRDKSIWVFGCYDGYIDNTKYFFEFASLKRGANCFWLANNKAEAVKVRSLGFNAVVKSSITGYWLSSRAYLTFVCTGFSDVNRFLSLTSKVINFWHGTPIKKIFFDSKYDLQRFGNNFVLKLMADIALKFLISRYAFYYASNELERRLVCSAARMKLENSIATGVPRFDIIRNNPKSLLLQEFRKKYTKIYVYAPTWRENGHWDVAFNIGDDFYDELNSTLMEANSLLIIKNHPLTQVNEIKNWGLNPSPNIKYSFDLGVDDLNDLYAYSDVLITDVSSSMFDYLIFNRPTYIFMPDVDEYTHGSRGIYEYFIEILHRNALKDWEGILDIISGSNKTGVELELRAHCSLLNLPSSVNECIYSDLMGRFYKEYCTVGH
jgi:CDP-glycerol glycerophosphotransferase (TagB/SpsB family)